MQRKILAQFVRFWPTDVLCSISLPTHRCCYEISYVVHAVKCERFIERADTRIIRRQSFSLFVVLAPAWSIPSTIGLTAGNPGHTCFARGKRISGVSDICHIGR